MSAAEELRARPPAPYNNIEKWLNYIEKWLNYIEKWLKLHRNDEHLKTQIGTPQHAHTASCA